ncbi:MAG: hypothetical protein ACKVQQ_07545 [Burkholderiales bacterium]
MNHPSIGLPSDADMRASADALRRAALRAQAVARSTGTGLVVEENDKPVVVAPDDFTLSGSPHPAPLDR